MNKLTVKIYIDEETKYELSSDYNPSDTSSISNCISDIINQAEGFKEDLNGLNEKLARFGKGELKVTRARFIFAREDGSIINNIEVNDVKDAVEKLDFTTNFFII